jgi:cell division protein FtsI/penicillin-binding protein 2
MHRRVIAVLTAAALVLTGATACSSKPTPDDAVNKFADFWAHGKADGLQLQDTGGGALDQTAVWTQLKKLAGDLAPAKAALSKVSMTTNGDKATATEKVNWTVAEGVVWSYETKIDLVKSGDAWKVVWKPAVINPQLLDGDTLAVNGVSAERGQILDGTGAAIVKPRPVIEVGVQPSEIKDQAALIKALDTAFKSANTPIDLSDLPARIAAADPKQFVSVVTLRREVYDSIRSQIHELPGTQFHEGMLPLAPTREFARALLGTVGEVTREQLDKNPGRYVQGDQVGQAGLQQTYDVGLRGTSGVKVLITGRKNSAGEAQAEVELFSVDPKAGTPLKTTLDQKIQIAADKALAGQTLRTSIVAIKVSDGSIVAVANGPNGGDLNLAFTGSVPPGSTFKMITALGLLDKGAVTADTPVNCPKTFTVQGRSFTNAGGFELGTVPFHTDFAKSCNTAFASLAPALKPDLLQKAAASVGVGTAWNPGMEANTGTVPANVSDVEAAAAAFGQGQTLVSPLSMAGAVAAVARGSWQQPKLLIDAPAGGPAVPNGPKPPANGTALNANSLTALRAMMREVVTAGTATPLASVGGGDVFAKTGTAEFDNNDPNNTHAWTVGWRGDIAFAVFVEKGGSSASTAVPIAAAFLRGF